jgi:hypothetical protein
MFSRHRHYIFYTILFIIYLVQDLFFIPLEPHYIILPFARCQMVHTIFVHVIVYVV